MLWNIRIVEKFESNGWQYHESALFLMYKCKFKGLPFKVKTIYQAHPSSNYRGHITSGHIWHTQRGDSRRVCAVISTKYTVGFKEGVGGMMVSGLELLACV